MSRGLSCQRRQILGLGRAVNRAVNGELRLIEGVIDASKEHWRVPVLFGYGFPEIHVRRVMHLLHGVPVNPDHKPGERFVDSPEVRSLKASTIRAIGSLCRRDLLIYRPGWTEWPGHRLDRHHIVYRNALAEAQGFSVLAHNPFGWPEQTALASLKAPEAYSVLWGYALTPAGADAGAGHDPDLASGTILEAIRSLTDWETYWFHPAKAALDALK
jgi:hypothetical protein